MEAYCAVQCLHWLLIHSFVRDFRILSFCTKYTQMVWRNPAVWQREMFPFTPESEHSHFFANKLFRNVSRRKHLLIHSEMNMFFMIISVLQWKAICRKILKMATFISTAELGINSRSFSGKTLCFGPLLSGPQKPGVLVEWISKKQVGWLEEHNVIGWYTMLSSALAGVG